MGHCGICGTEHGATEQACRDCGAPLLRDRGVLLQTDDIPVRRYGEIPPLPEVWRLPPARKPRQKLAGAALEAARQAWSRAGAKLRGSGRR